MGLSASMDILPSEEWSRSALVVVVVWVDQHWWVAGLWVGLWVDRCVRGGGSGGFCDGGCGCCLVGLVGVDLVDFFFSLLWAVVVVVVVVVVCVAVMYVCSEYIILL